MTDDELLALVESEERNALGYGDSQLNADREKALKYYLQDPLGNEQPGRSQVVTSEVADTVEWILPALMKIFTTSEKAVEFEPERPEDTEGAKQATDVVNYVFYKKNQGFIVLYSFFKDALLTKNGYVKVYWEKGERKRKQTYRGLTGEQLVELTRNEGVEVIAGNSYPDPMAQQMQMSQPQMGGPMPNALGTPMMAPPLPVPMLYDVQVEVTEPYGKTCVVALPPEEVLISKDLNSVDLREANFVAHRGQKTLSELREMGYDAKVLSSLSTSESFQTTPEAEVRREFDEDGLSADKVDRSMRTVWVTEAYIRVDFDDDGIAELRKVVKAGHKILENEETEVIPIAAITPTIMTHRHFGRSIADWVMDLQEVMSSTLRGTLDNMYFTNSPRNIVLADRNTDAPQANVSDLLNVRVGGIVREYVPNAIRPLTIPFMGQTGLEMMQYLNTVKDLRVGFTGQFSGLDADALNKTARGAVLQQTNAMQKIEMIARIFAETGVKRIFQLILHCLATYGEGRPIAIRLRDKWEEYDPTGWDTQMDMTVNVGLGTGDKDQQLGHLMTIANNQQLAVQAGGMGLILTPKNIYNAQAKIVENAGFKNVEDFWTDPQDKMPQPAQNPQLEADKQKAQLESVAKQQDMGLKKQSADQEFMHKERMANLDMAQKQAEFQMERERAGWQDQRDQQKSAMEMQNAQMTQANDQTGEMAQGVQSYGDQLLEHVKMEAEAIKEYFGKAEQMIEAFARDQSSLTAAEVRAQVKGITDTVKGVVEEVQALKKPKKRTITAPSGKQYLVEDQA